MKKGISPLVLGVVLLVAVVLSAGVYYSIESVQKTQVPASVSSVTVRGGPPQTAPGITSNGSITEPLIDQIKALPKQSLSPEEVNGILYMREEEKLARDVYLTLYQKWHLPIFQNIARSEQTHMDAVKALIEKYGLQDPDTNDAVGAFSDPHFEELYKELVAEGSKSIVDALKVGALIEELDIKDLQEWLSKADNEDIKLAFCNLMKGSRNHLRAFVSQLRRYGATYTPKYISEQEFNAILSGSVETGVVQCQ